MSTGAVVEVVSAAPAVKIWAQLVDSSRVSVALPMQMKKDLQLQNGLGFRVYIISIDI